MEINKKANTTFELVQNGRSGEIVYTSNSKCIRFYYEISGTPRFDILLAPINLRELEKPKGEVLSIEMQLEVLTDLRRWLIEKKIKSDIDLPSDISLSNEKCGWNQCNKHRINGKAYCIDHFNKTLLRNP